MRTVAKTLGRTLGSLAQVWMSRRQPTHGRRLTRLSFVSRRLIAIVPVVLGISLFAFVMLDRLPGNAAQQLLGADATPQQVALLEKQLNLDRPAWERYGYWLGDVLRGNLGKSLSSGQPVRQLLAERSPVTIELVAFALLIAVCCAIPIALLAARRPHGLADRLCSILTMGALCMPSYILSLLLVLIFSVTLRMFPSIGYVAPSEGIAGNLRSLTLPAVAIALPLFGLYARFLRSDLLDQMLGAPYVVTAFAKGLTRWRVLVHHALRGSLFGLLTLVSLHIGTLLGSTVVVEQIFALPGIGQLLLQAFNTRDVALIQAILGLLALITLGASLAADLLYATIDPRVRHAAG
jgi:peptide/nickel transport system permease protein